MDDLLLEIKMLPGVRGVFVSIDKPDIIFSDVQAGYSNEILKQMDASLQRIFKMNATCRFSVNSVEIQFPDVLILVKHVCAGALLVICCDPDANFSLINMTSNMLVSEFALGIDRVRADPQAALAAQAVKKAGGGAVDFAQAQKQEPLKSAIPVFQDALARAIGPIAAMIVKETIEKWLQAGASKKERFPALADAFCQEIGDAALEKDFRNDIKQLML